MQTVQAPLAVALHLQSLIRNLKVLLLGFVANVVCWHGFGCVSVVVNEIGSPAAVVGTRVILSAVHYIAAFNYDLPIVVQRFEGCAIP